MNQTPAAPGFGPAGVHLLAFGPPGRRAPLAAMVMSGQLAQLTCTFVKAEALCLAGLRLDNLKMSMVGLPPPDLPPGSNGRLVKA